MSSPELASDPRFTVFVRLPFARGDFVDPPQSSWDARNDRVLWDALSVAPKDGVDWKALAEKFDVTLSFLYQHVAWLYDRRLSQVRAQIRRVGHQDPPSGQPISADGGTPSGSVPMNRSGSDGMRIQSRLSALQRDIILANRADSNRPGTPLTSQGLNYPPAFPNFIEHALIPRTQSPRETVTTFQRPSRRSSDGVPETRMDDETRSTAFSPLSPRQDDDSPGPLSPSSASSSSEESDRPQYRRFGKHSIVQKRIPQKPEDDEEEDDSPAFLPLETLPETATGTSRGDPASTLRETHHQANPHRRRVSGETTPPAKEYQALPETSTASSSSADPPIHQPPVPPPPPTGPLSPRRTAELSGRSPHGRLIRREGSEGSPSMGSSFSDLDDASVSQSALEEALLSNMQRSGVTSRMSTISQALRSRYL